MKPLQRANPVPGDKEIVRSDLIKKWKAGDATVRQLLPGDEREAIAAIDQILNDEITGCQLWINDLYQVSVRPVKPGGLHISIRRLDRQPCHDWRDFQEIKNQLAGPECEAIELYPAESRRVDSANQYHIWCVKDAKYRFPFGFNDRLVTEDSLANSEAMHAKMVERVKEAQ